MKHSPAGRNLPLDWVGGSDPLLALCRCHMPFTNEL